MDSIDPIPIRIEVSISDIMDGVFGIEGTLSGASDYLSLRYTGRDLRGREKYTGQLDLGVDDLRDVVLKERPWGLRIELHPRRLTAFSDLPGDSHDKVVLRARRKHRHRAREIVSLFREGLEDRADYDIGGIPFSLPDVGVEEIKGVLFLEPGYLVMEIVSGLPGVTKSRSKEIRIETSAVDRIWRESGATRDSLYVGAGPDLLEAIPGRHSREIRLRIARRHREDVDILVQVVNSRTVFGSRET